MLKLPLAALIALDAGTVKPTYKAVVYWSNGTETYTEDDKLVSVGDLSTGMSEGRYEIANTTVVLKNEEYYFSRRMARELPNNKLAEIYLTISGEDILAFRGIIPKTGGWKLTDMGLTLNVNA